MIRKKDSLNDKYRKFEMTQNQKEKEEALKLLKKTSYLKA